MLFTEVVMYEYIPFLKEKFDFVKIYILQYKPKVKLEKPSLFHNGEL